MSALENRKFNPGPLYLVAAAILWSMAGVLTKFIPWSATTVACMRGLIAAMIQMLYSRTWKIKLTKPILLTAVCYLGETLLFTFANKMTSAGSAIVLQNTSPLYIMLMGLIVLKQKPSKLDCCVGVVIFSGWGNAAGNYITIDHHDGFKSIYMHLNGFAVGSGTNVSAGQLIGYTGSTGVSTGDHLHFGISLNGVYVNPCSYVPL